MTSPAAAPAAHPALPVPDSVRGHPSWIRLEDQLRWYEQKSAHNQRMYKRLKVLQITLAVAVPVLSGSTWEWSRELIALCGAGIAVLEGVQQLFQYSMLWITYRATAERLVREKYLLLAGAGPYRGLGDAERMLLLAEHVEETISTENSSWVSNAQPGASRSASSA